MLIIDNATIAELLTMRDCIAVQEKAFAEVVTGESVSRPRLDTFSPCERSDGYHRFGSIEGSSGGIHAVRMKSDIMTWPKAADGSWSEHKYCVEPGIYCGLILLFSTANGAPLAILNDGYLQHMRVGAAAGIGARLLSRPDSHTVALIGSGGMAETVLQAMVEVRPIDKVRVFSRSSEKRERFAARMAAELGLQVEAVATAQDAVRGADIVATATDSMLPVVHGEWLEPGMHVVNIGPLDLSADCEDRIDLVVRQGNEAFDLPETDGFRRDLGHSRSAFVAGTPEQQTRLPPVVPKQHSKRRWPLYADVISGKGPSGNN
ncbi:ornithine cyclodeaminase family protein [Acidisphaera sp. L21]|uniref:ornithine cyclodeaminase family protein n=1 Tax=Acidisphaera sp. L21 TaxID=1641851 RepID=UPI00131ECD0E|nr:NAD(P)-binding domain-containing protein [Acidisphaera sp. L21]